MRKTAGLTGDQIARQLGWPRSKVPKLENGRQMPSEDDLGQWARACDQAGELPGLLDMLSEAQAVHRQWRHRIRKGHAAIQAEFDTLVRQAARVRNFEILLVPGLLQTAGYARHRALEAVRLHGAPEDGVEDAVAARMRRQEVLYASVKTFEFVITEAALRYLLCPPQVMLGQLDRLMTIAGLGNVTLGIIPPGTELAVAPMVGFLMADEVTVVETFTSADTYRGRESAAYERIADALLAQAVTGQEAADVIRQAMEDLGRKPR